MIEMASQNCPSLNPLRENREKNSSQKKIFFYVEFLFCLEVDFSNVSSP